MFSFALVSSFDPGVEKLKTPKGIFFLYMIWECLLWKFIKLTFVSRAYFCVCCTSIKSLLKGGRILVPFCK